MGWSALGAVGRRSWQRQGSARSLGPSDRRCCQRGGLRPSPASASSLLCGLWCPVALGSLEPVCWDQPGAAPPARRKVLFTCLPVGDHPVQPGLGVGPPRGPALGSLRFCWKLGFGRVRETWPVWCCQVLRPCSGPLPVRARLLSLVNSAGRTCALVSGVDCAFWVRLVCSLCAQWRWSACARAAAGPRWVVPCTRPRRACRCCRCTWELALWRAWPGLSPWGLRLLRVGGRGASWTSRMVLGAVTSPYRLACARTDT